MKIQTWFSDVDIELLIGCLSVVKEQLRGLGCNEAEKMVGKYSKNRIDELIYELERKINKVAL